MRNIWFFMRRVALTVLGDVGALAQRSRAGLKCDAPPALLGIRKNGSRAAALQNVRYAWRHSPWSEFHVVGVDKNE